MLKHSLMIEFSFWKSGVFKKSKLNLNLITRLTLLRSLNNKKKLSLIKKTRSTVGPKRSCCSKEGCHENM
jgi:hypothetical protein